MFDNAFCLILDRRANEQERISEEFAQHGIRVNYFVAGNGGLLPAACYNHVDVDPDGSWHYPWKARKGSYNAFLCFRMMIRWAKLMGWSDVLILEDDVTLLANFTEVVTAAREQLPNDWHLFYLGANHTWGKTRRIGPNMLRLLGGSQCWHAVVVRNTIYDAILSLPLEGPIDDMCARLIQPHPDFRCYAVWPSIAVQKPGFSWCDNKHQDYLHYFGHPGTETPG